MRNRPEFLARIVGVDMMGFSVMSSHLHVILRSRPDVVRECADEEIAQERMSDLKSADDVATADAKDIRIEHGRKAGWLLWNRIRSGRKLARSVPVAG